MDAVFAAAFASTGWIDDAVASMQSGHVYVAPGSGSASLADTLSAEIGDASIGVAVFSSDVQLEGLRETEVLSQLQDGTGYDTIVIAVGGRLYADSEALGQDEAMIIAKENESQHDSLQPALQETVQEISVAARSTDGPAGSVDGGMILVLALVAAGIVAAAGTAWGVIRARRRRPAVEQGMPEGVRARVAALRALRPAYAASPHPVARQTAADIDSLTANVTELFTRLDKHADAASQRGLASVEYEEKLRRLGAALDRDYLLDILTHPHLWDDPQERVAEVRDAVTAVAGELVENIKQVNARRGLYFQVSLDGLISGRKELRDWERAFNSASDDDRR